MSTSKRQQEVDDGASPDVTEAEAVVEITATAETPVAATDQPIEATAEQPALSERDISAMADPHNASSPMATDGPGRRDDNATPESGSGAPIPWPFSN